MTTLRGASRESLLNASEVAIAQQRLRLRRYLSTLATIGSTAPFIGLFGTVLGVLGAFKQMGQAGQGAMEGSAVAGQIGTALSATAHRPAGCHSRCYRVQLLSRLSARSMCCTFPATFRACFPCWKHRMIYAPP